MMTAFHNLKIIYSLILSDYMRYVFLRNPERHTIDGTIRGGGEFVDCYVVTDYYQL